MRAGKLVISVSDDASQTGLLPQRGEIGTGDQLNADSYHLAARSACIDSSVYAPSHTQRRGHIGKDFITPPNFPIKWIRKDIPAPVREAADPPHVFPFPEEQ